MRVRNQASLVCTAMGLMCLFGITLVVLPHPSALLVAVIFFSIGFLTGSQTIAFTWLITNMRPELIGRNSAANSMLFMGAGGGLKQIGAVLLVMPAIIFGKAAAENLILLISVMMFVGTLYVVLRNKIFASTKEIL